MARKKSMRSELEQYNIIRNNKGVEIARLTLNGLLVINEQELFFAIVRNANNNGYAANMTELCIEFGKTGGWAYDISVDNALRHLEELKLVKLILNDLDENKIYRIQPIVPLRTAIKTIPEYITLEETLAGLEPVDE
jgi:hypothetical protein